MFLFWECKFLLSVSVVFQFLGFPSLFTFGGSGSCTDGPVKSGILSPMTSGSLSSRLPIILFFNVLSNSGLCIYFTAINAKILIDETIKNEIIDKILAILEKVMVKQAILKAISHTLIISMLIILPTIAPLYLITSMMTKQMVHQKS